MQHNTSQPRNRLFIIVLLLFAIIMSGSTYLIKLGSHKELSKRSNRTTRWVKINTQNFFDRHVQWIMMLVAFYENSDFVSREKFEHFASKITYQRGGYQSLNYVDTDFIIQRIYPFENNLPALQLNLKSRPEVMPTAKKAIKERRLITSHIIDLVQGGQGFIIFAPIYKDDFWEGLIEGVFRTDLLVNNYFEKYVGPYFAYTIIDKNDGHKIYTSLDPNRRNPANYDTNFNLLVGDRTWQVTLHPKYIPSPTPIIIIVLSLEGVLLLLVLFLSWKKRPSVTHL